MQQPRARGEPEPETAPALTSSAHTQLQHQVRLLASCCCCLRPAQLRSGCLASHLSDVPAGAGAAGWQEREARLEAEEVAAAERQQLARTESELAAVRQQILSLQEDVDAVAG
jgi:hypothetical protein